MSNVTPNTLASLIAVVLGRPASLMDVGITVDLAETVSFCC